MNAITPELHKSAPYTPQDMHPAPGREIAGQGGADAMSMKWAALHDAAAAVASLAGIEPEPPTPQICNFPAQIRNAGTLRSRLAENGIADLAAMMEPGLRALLAIRERGVDPEPAALALWREFCAGRAAILELGPPDGKFAPNCVV